jgi:RHS repeat-associated protein
VGRWPRAGSRKRLTGHGRDESTVLDHVLARYHSPGLGRFLSVDPVVRTAPYRYDPALWNRYDYGLQNPIKYDDPDGREIRNKADNDAAVFDTAEHLSKSPTIQKFFGDDAKNDLEVWAVVVDPSATNKYGEADTTVYQNDRGGFLLVLRIDPFTELSKAPKTETQKEKETRHEFGEASLWIQGIRISDETDHLATEEGERLGHEADEAARQRQAERAYNNVTCLARFSSFMLNLPRH